MQQSFQYKGRRRLILITIYLVIESTCDVLGRRPETVQAIGKHNVFSILFYVVIWLFHFLVFRDNVTEEINDALSN